MHAGGMGRVAELPLRTVHCNVYCCINVKRHLTDKRTPPGARSAMLHRNLREGIDVTF